MSEPEAGHGDPRGRRALVIHNPTAGGDGARFTATLERLGALGCRVEVRPTAGRGDAEALARRASGEGVDLVVAAGGDGTVNEVINGLAGSGLPLALIPLGTANVLAIEIGLELRPDALAQTIATGEPRPIALGRLHAAAGGERLFVAMAGVGVDAHAVAGVNLGLKRVLGKGAYYVEVLRQLLVFPFPRYRLRLDGTAFEAASVVVANGRRYAGRYLLAPAARLGDARFQVCLFERSGRAAALGYALAMWLGRLPRRRDYRVLSARRVVVEGPAGEPVQADGDIVAHLPVEIEIVPRALRLVMPDPGSA